MSGNAFGITAGSGTLRRDVLLVGFYAAALCWIGAALVIVSIPGFALTLKWFLVPPAALTLGLWVVWLGGRERPVPRKPQHLPLRGRHAIRASTEPAPHTPRSALSASLLTVSAYTAALAWAGLLAMAFNGSAFLLGSAILIVPLMATLLALFAWSYRGHPRPGTE